MDSKNTIQSRHSRGVAMFVVLGVIVVLTLLGFMGIQLAKNDSDISGGAVDMKSQSMTAIAGLNMAVAQMSHDDDNLVAMINAFKASVTTAPLKPWIVFGGSNLTLASTDPGFATSLGSDGSSCKVRILGIEKIGASASTLDITLESTGRGRSGDVHTVVATYRMSGLNSLQNTNSVGPSNALQSNGGFSTSGFNQHVAADGGVYSGGGLLLLQPAAGNNTSTKIRANGDVQLNSDIIIAENSVINGYLDLNGGNGTFNKNLILNGNLQNNRTLTVNGSLIFGGNTVSGKRSGTIIVGTDLLVNGFQFVTEGPLTVGPSAATTSRAWFMRGIQVVQAGGARTINGSMYVVNDGANDDGLRDFTINNDLRCQGSAPRTMRVNTTVVNQDAYFQLPLTSGIFGSYTGGSGLTVNGKTTLLCGFVGNNNQDHKFVGEVYLKGIGAGQDGLVPGGSFTFGSGLSMNGTIGAFWPYKWSFYAGAKNWSYTSTNNCTGLRSANQMVSGISVSCRNSDSIVPDWVGAMPAVITATSLGYSANDLDLNNSVTGVNAPSAVTTSRLPADVKTASKWSYMKTHSGACATSSTYRPTATQITCIYNYERARYNANSASYTGPLYKGTDNAYKFLVIDVDESWSTGAVPTDLVIPKGVHVMFLLNTSNSNLNSWYTNVEGSTQVVIINQDPGSFSWNGTVFGFVQFNVPGKSGLQIGAGSDVMTLYGALESADITTTLQPNSGTLNVSINDSKAKDARDNIVTAFTSNTAANDILRFNGDKGVVIGTTSTLSTNDGWVQFQRLGEYR